MANSFYDFKVQNAAGQEVDLSIYTGKYVLVVNVASKCGFTPQYSGLEEVYKKFENKGLVILGFPCNQFGFQEPGSNEEIQQFCSMNYNVTFPIMAKVDVNGSAASPVYNFMKESAPGLLGTEMIKWNFTKFLIGPDGKVIRRFAPNETPEEIGRELAKMMNVNV